MQDLKIFIELTRLNKPIGFMLLFWPCSWGLAYAYKANQDFDQFGFYLILFFFGSILMRSAGCIFNDIVDKDFDKKVKRTKMRPVASGKISVQRSLLYVLILCAFAFLILIQFNTLTVLLGLGSMFLAFSYPFMKRITYWPQLFLGITFNWGIVMAWASISSNISPEVIIFYISAIFWTLGYDTIYGTQDMSDDEIIGLKSTSIKFKKNIKMFVSICYLLNSLVLFMLFFKFFESKQLIFFLGLYFISLIYQIRMFDKRKPKSCLDAFKINNLSGLFLFLSIYLY
jgi:4-hydroxybenzoate polyprenyltransferase